MNLSDIARNILKEDTWGNNPSAAGGMSPGRTPTATSPSPTSRRMDIFKLYEKFKLELETQEDASIKKFSDQLKKTFLKKKVRINAGKGGAGQMEKEYDVVVSDIDVRYMKDKYYIVFTGKEGDGPEKEYYLDDSIIEVDDSATPVSQTGRTGGMVSPQTIGMTGKRNILPQG